MLLSHLHSSVVCRLIINESLTLVFMRLDSISKSKHSGTSRFFTSCRENTSKQVFDSIPERPNYYITAVFKSSEPTFLLTVY